MAESAKKSGSDFTAYRIYDLNDNSFLIYYDLTTSSYPFRNEYIAKLSKQDAAIEWTMQIPQSIQSNMGIVTDTTNGKFAILSITDTGDSLTSINCYYSGKLTSSTQAALA